MIPGEVIAADGDIEWNAGIPDGTERVTVHDPIV
jgi:urease gamma subunit